MSDSFDPAEALAVIQEARERIAASNPSPY